MTLSTLAKESKIKLPKVFFLLKRHELLSLILYTLHILFNLTGSPLLKIFYFLEMAFFIFLAFKYRWKDLFIPTFVFFFIEGQGRILGSYHPLHRTIFDLYLFVLVLRHYVSKKSIMLPNQIPLFFKLILLGHIGWYFIQFFNVDSLGVLATFVATKVYIFPILMFFMFLEDPLPFDKKDEDARYFAILWILALQLFLVFFQLNIGEQSLLSITPFYRRSMYGEVFTGEFFRPYGTGFVPGGISIYLACSVAFLFLPKYKSFKQVVTTALLIALIFAANFVMQVRVSLLMAFVTTFSCIFVSIVKSKLRFIGLTLLISSIALIPLMINNIHLLQDYFPEANLRNSIERIQAISSIEKAASRRASFSKVIDKIGTTISTAPMGLGPARTGGAAGMFKEMIRKDPKFDLGFSWALDNLYVSLAIDLGLGMIFYTVLILGLPFYVLSKTFSNWRLERENAYQVSTPLIAVSITILTSWGAISIPYNPISFFYWFWLAYAIQLLSKEKEVRSIDHA